MSTSVQPSNRRGPSQAASWLSERLGLQGLAYAVPEHANSLPYLLGGITLYTCGGWLVMACFCWAWC